MPEPGIGSPWETAVRELRADVTRQALVRDAYFDDPIVQAAERYRSSDEWQEIRKLLPSRSCTVLDVGAGRGIASFALANEGHRVFALEPDPSPLIGTAAIRELARVTGTKIEVSEGVSEALPFPDQTFDVVFARAVLHHASDLNTLCREVYRVLRGGGTFIAIREHVISRHDDLESFLAAHPLHRYYGGENAYLLGYYQAALNQAGFKMIGVLAPLASAINYAPYTLKTLKRRLAKIAASGVPLLEATIYAVLRIPGMWWLLRHGLQYIDSRPGRLYSFIASKP